MATLVTGIGFGLMVVGTVIVLLGVGARMEYLRHIFSPDSLPLWFRAEGLVLSGGSVTVLGIIVAYRLWWPWLPIVGVFGVGAALLLGSRYSWW